MKAIASAHTVNAPTMDATPGAKRESGRPGGRNSPASPVAVARTAEPENAAGPAVSNNVPRSEHAPARGRVAQVAGLSVVGVLILAAGFTISARGFPHSTSAEPGAPTTSATTASTPAASSTLAVAPTLSLAPSATGPTGTNDSVRPALATAPSAPTPNALPSAGSNLTTPTPSATESVQIHPSHPRPLHPTPSASAAVARPAEAHGISIDQLDRK